jgi:hypothetical protein
VSDELTPEERDYAQRFGISAREYAALKGIRNIADWDRWQAAERERAERERLKAAIRETLDERDRGR